MIKLYDFIDLSKIEEIAYNIKKKKDFEYENDVDGYKLTIYSSKAATDWKDGTKSGEYIVSIGFSTTGRGTSGPFSGDELKVLSDADELKDILDDFLSDRRIKGYKTLNEGQIDLFSLTV